MRSPVPVCAIVSLLMVLPFLAGAQLPPLSAPGVRYALGGHANAVNAVALSSDGLTFASASTDDTVKIWRMSDGMLLHTFVPNPQTPVFSVALSPDGTAVAAGDNSGTISIWNLTTGLPIRQIATGFSGGVYSVSYSSDSATLAASGAGNNISLYNTSDGSLQRILTGHTKAVSQIAFSPTNSTTLASISQDLTLRLWNTASGATAQTLNAFNSSALCLAFSYDGTQVAAGGADSTAPYDDAKSWSVATGAQTAGINAYNGGSVTAVAFSRSGALLATGGYAGALPEIFTLPAGTPVSTATGHTAAISSVGFSLDGKTLVSAGADALILQSNVADGTPLRPVTQIVWGSPAHLAFTSDSSRMGLGIGGVQYGSFQFRSAPTGANVLGPAVNDLSRESGGPFTFSPDGTLLAWAATTPELINLANGATLYRGERSAYLWISKDNQTVYTYNDPTLKFWRMKDNVLLKTVTIGGALLAISNDQTRGVFVSGGIGITVNSLPDGALLQSFFTTGVTSNISISGNGSYIAFGTNSSDAYVYRVSDGAQLLDQVGNPGVGVLNVAISPFGDSIATLRGDYTVTVSQLDGTELAYWNDQVCPLVPGSPYSSYATQVYYTPDAASIVFEREDATVLVCYNPAPAALAGFAVTPSQVEGGLDNFYNPQVGVSINLPAPPGGVPILLTSGDPTVTFTSTKTTTTTVLVPQGMTTATTALTTSAVSAYKTVPVFASLNGVTLTGSITLRPAIAVNLVGIAPNSVQGGLPAIGVVTLVSAAPTGGIPVSLTGNSYLTVPSTVTVPAGKHNAQFLVQTSAVSGPQNGVITAVSGGVTKSTMLRIVPAALAALTPLPGSIQSGEDSIGVIQLAAPTLTSVTVTVSSSNPAVASLDVASVTIPAGQSLGTFNITAGTVAAATKVTLTAKLYGVSKTATLTVTP